MTRKVALACVLALVASASGLYISRLTTLNTDAETAPEVITSQPRPSSNPAETPTNSAPSDIEEQELLPTAEPFVPYAMYSEYFDDAEAGDAASQFIIYTALDACKGMSMTSDIERLRRAGTSAELMDRIVARHHRCKDLHAEVPDLRQSYRQWLDRAVEGNDPVARLLKASWRNRLDEETKLIIRDALFSEYREPYLAGIVYFEIVALYANTAPYENVFRREAWGLMSCNSTYECDNNFALEDLKQRYHQHDYDEILRIVSTFEKHIRNQEWDDLGF